MASSIALAVGAFVAYLLYSNISGILRNIASAKRTGLPYVVIPIRTYNPLWLASHRIWHPYLLKLPKAWTEDWLPFMLPDWPWTDRFEPFAKHGDVVLTVSPGGIQIWLANAEAISQICARREAFPKPLESYKILDIFGRNVVTTEGGEWRQHRKITAPGFNEKNNALVFAESIKQTEGMLSKWMAAGEKGKKTIEGVPADTMRLTLHIISKVGFGVELLWPGQTPSEKSSRDAVYSSNEPPEGHTLSFENALEALLENFLWVILTPKSIFKHLPFQSSKKAYEAYVNWSDYMNELFAQKVQEARDGQHGEGMDIMGSLVRSSYGESKPNANVKRKPSPCTAEKEEVTPILTDTEILGNAFVMIIAGHETTANSVHFSLMELALNPSSQRLMHKEVESLFGNEPPENWNYEKNINALLGGVVGAVLNEQLRVMPPVVGIPKSVTKTQDQVIILNGKKVTLPAGSQISLNTIAAHRNPKHWPSQPSKITDAPNDLDEFRPERWLVKTAGSVSNPGSNNSSDDEESFGGPTEDQTSAQLFRPVKGSYIPFSEGARSCLGRRLAQIEMMAVLAVIFQKYSVELAVDEWATDKEVAMMSKEEKTEVYKKAQAKARETLRGATTRITLKLHGDPGFVPIRVVKKGDERFVYILD